MTIFLQSSMWMSNCSGKIILTTHVISICVNFQKMFNILWIFSNYIYVLRSINKKLTTSLQKNVPFTLGKFYYVLTLRILILGYWRLVSSRLFSSPSSPLSCPACRSEIVWDKIWIPLLNFSSFSSFLCWIQWWCQNLQFPLFHFKKQEKNELLVPCNTPWKFPFYYHILNGQMSAKNKHHLWIVL